MNCSACAGYVDESEAYRGTVEGDKRRITTFLCRECKDDIFGDSTYKRLSLDDVTEAENESEESEE